jgi:predicted ribosomally synthesized peptide with SipW-like signal peptide
MTTKKKALAAIIAVCLIVCLTAGASLAYLTDKTDDVTNTFTVGKVDIKLEETNPESNTKQETGLTGLKLVPGDTTAKDPTVTVLKDSEACYVRVKVVVTGVETYTHLKDDDAVKALFVQKESPASNFVADSTVTVSGNTATIYYYYKDSANNDIVKSAATDTSLGTVFDYVKCPTWVTETNAEDFGEKFTVTVTAEAIQSASFENAGAAWSAFDTQTTTTAD